jgi:hypothetical protein
LSKSSTKLLDDVKSLAAALRVLGVEKRDRVTIYMPIVPEAIDRPGEDKRTSSGPVRANKMSARLGHSQLSSK